MLWTIIFYEKARSGKIQPTFNFYFLSIVFTNNYNLTTFHSTTHYFGMKFLNLFLGCVPSPFQVERGAFF